VVAASGGSTNAALHLPAIAHECGIKFDLFDVAEIFKKTPYIAGFEAGRPLCRQGHVRSWRHPASDEDAARSRFLHGDCMTVTGRTMAENLKKVKWNPDQDVVRPANKPITVTGGVVGLKGNLAPEGAIVKVAGMAEPEVHRPRALLRLRRRCVRGREEPHLQGRRRLVIRYEGPKRRPRHARNALHHGGALRAGHGRQGRAHHRWTLSPARRAASASAMSGRRLRSAGRSA
jgi:dihydroxy-acid dehydratase